MNEKDLNLKIAELLGWRWEDNDLTEGFSDIAIWGDKLTGAIGKFNPAGNAEQATKLLDGVGWEMGKDSHKDMDRPFYCLIMPDGNPFTGFLAIGNTLMEAICAAWIEWKESAK